MPSTRLWLLLCLVTLCFLAKPSLAFGAGNIASVSAIEGQNWRHGDIEDVLKTVACLKGHKWTSMMIRRVYFGNWLRDYSQAVDVGTLKGTNKETIRILIWILGFMSFGYATQEFEVTEERLGTYRPEEHIDNPKDYADNVDARQYDPRLRGPVAPVELEIDPDTGMKNYIANERGNWATSLGYVKHSFARSIHFGRMYTSGASGRGNEADLCEALRCLGQGLHCLEDFGAHTNYTELALRELGFHDVFPHVGTATEINLRGKRVYPLVTGTFGGVDFLHSVLGEVTDHVTQSEAQEKSDLDVLKGNLEQSRSGGQALDNFTSLLAKVPGTDGLAREAESLQQESDAEVSRVSSVSHMRTRADPSQGYSEMQQPAQAPVEIGSKIQSIEEIDLKGTVKKIYPILEFRDRVMRNIEAIVSKIPGLEYILEKISETITLFIMSLLAPFVIPIITLASKQLKTGSSVVVSAAAQHQFEPWTDSRCTDPTHSLLSKDHFSNILNEPAGQVAAEIVKFVAPRIIYAWDNPDVPVDEVMNDVARVFHHPAARENRLEIHSKMFGVIEGWINHLPDRGSSLNHKLNADSVKRGGNHTTRPMPTQHGYNSGAGLANLQGFMGGSGGSHGNPLGSLGSMVGKLAGGGGHSHGGGTFGQMSGAFNQVSNLLGNTVGRRDIDEELGPDGRPIGTGGPGGPQSENYGQHQHNQFGGDYRGGQVGYDRDAPPGQQYGQPGFDQRYQGQDQYGGQYGGQGQYGGGNQYGERDQYGRDEREDDGYGRRQQYDEGYGRRY